MSDMTPRPDESTGAPTIGVRILSIFNLRPGEGLPVLIAGSMFFFILCGYFFVRPVRDAFGVQGEMRELYSLFIATMVASLALNPVFSWLVGRFDRRVFLPIAFGSITVMMLGFAFYRAIGADTKMISEWTGRIFFVWLSVINLFMTGLFWSLMSDCFGGDDAKRAFPAIAVGGTIGALLGTATSWAVSGYPFEVFGTDLFDLGIKLSAPQMMVAAGVFVGVAAVLSIVLSVIRPESGRTTPAAERSGSGFGDAVDGIRLAAESRYLRSIAIYIGLLAVLTTFVYFTQAELIQRAGSSESEKVGMFASIAFWEQVATLLIQLLLTARLMRWIGVGWTMAILPMLFLVGFAVLAFGERAGWSVAAMFTALTVVKAVLNAAKYSIARPSRETCFAVLGRDEKYKAKSLLDTFVYRAGDTAGAAGFAGITSKIAPAIAVTGLMGLSLTVAPIAIVMAGLALSIGAQRRGKAGVIAASDAAAP